MEVNLGTGTGVARLGGRVTLGRGVTRAPTRWAASLPLARLPDPGLQPSWLRKLRASGSWSVETSGAAGNLQEGASPPGDRL